jgi:hypothetical protein
MQSTTPVVEGRVERIVRIVIKVRVGSLKHTEEYGRCHVSVSDLVERAQAAERRVHEGELSIPDFRRLLFLTIRTWLMIVFYICLASQKRRRSSSPFSFAWNRGELFDRHGEGEERESSASRS